jgi:hypothetical protein
MRGSIGIESIVDKIRENRLRWFRQMIRCEVTKAVRVVMKINVEEKRRRVRLKKIWLDMIENDMRAIGVWVGDIENRDKKRFWTRVANPK